MARWTCQVAALARKNLLLMRRRRALTCFELLMPLLLVVILGLIDLSFQTPAPSGSPPISQYLPSMRGLDSSMATTATATAAGRRVVRTNRLCADNAALEL